MAEHAGASTGLPLREVAALVGGRLVGNPDLAIRGVAALSVADPSQIALLAAPRYRSEVGASRAGALLVAAALENGLEDARPRVVVSDPHAALIPLLQRLHPETTSRPGVHPTAVLASNVTLADDVEIGPFAVLGDECRVGAGARIGAH